MDNFTVSNYSYQGYQRVLPCPGLRHLIKELECSAQDRAISLVTWRSYDTQAQKQNVSHQKCLSGYQCKMYEISDRLLMFTFKNLFTQVFLNVLYFTQGNKFNYVSLQSQCLPRFIRVSQNNIYFFHVIKSMKGFKRHSLP